MWAMATHRQRVALKPCTASAQLRIQSLQRPMPSSTFCSLGLTVARGRKTALSTPILRRSYRSGMSVSGSLNSAHRSLRSAWKAKSGKTGSTHIIGFKSCTDGRRLRHLKLCPKEGRNAVCPPQRHRRAQPHSPKTTKRHQGRNPHHYCRSKRPRTDKTKIEPFVKG